jgi:hypothetical protein
MKTLFLALFITVMLFPCYSQQTNDGETKTKGPTPSELPAVVIKNAGKDFSIYLPDKNPDQRVVAMENKFIGYNLGKDYEGYDTYLVMLESETGTLTATYNKNGKLIHVVEKYSDVRLPNEVIYSVYKSFPGWSIEKDKYSYHQSDGAVLKKEYALKIKKDKETKNIVVSPSGEMLKF